MSLRRTLVAAPMLARVAIAEAVAYRAELFVWILATTMPLVMMALFTTVAAEAPVGRYGQREVVTYFLATFLIRQLTSSWAAWQMNFEVRQGTLAVRLLRPVHPLVAYAIENLAALPLRLVVAVPVAIGALASAAKGSLPSDPVVWIAALLAILGGWLLTFLINVAFGALSFFVESSMKLVDLYLVLFFVFSGYLFPVELFPGWARALVDWMPFRYQIGLPVELMTGVHGRARALTLLGSQWAFVATLLVATGALWRRGLRRFAAFGG